MRRHPALLALSTVSILAACGDSAATDAAVDATTDAPVSDGGLPDAAPDTSPPADPELVYIEDFVHAGSFRVPADMFGVSELNYSEGPLAVSGGSLFIVRVGPGTHAR